MKKTMYKTIFLAFVAIAAFSTCKSPTQKLEDSHDNVIQAQTELDKAQADYNADVEKFRKESNDKITANEKNIADFNARIVKGKNQANADYKRRMAILEQKNTDMKKKMADYKADGIEKWESFKTEFNHDMDELGNSLRDLTVDNK